MSEIPMIKAGAVLYTQFSAEGNALTSFAKQMQARGWKVGGIVQDVLRDEQGAKTGVDAVALDTGDRFPIVRPSKEDVAAGTCGLDRSALTASSEILRRARESKADLVIVEKFGEREQLGEGLSDDIMTAMAEGIPVLVAVPAAVVDKWVAFTGGLGDLLPASEQALSNWWDRENLYEELIRPIPDEQVKRVVIGLNWILVEGPHGSGLSHTPARGTAGCRSVPNATGLASKSLKELAKLAFSWNPFETALGIAAINAFYNRHDMDGEQINGFDAIGNTDGPVTIVGAFKNAAEKFKNARVVELNPADGQYPQSAANSLLRTSEGAIITASTLVNRSLPDLLQSCEHNDTVIVGPGTPLAPSLFHYNVDALSSLIVKDVDTVASVIASGGSVKEIKPHCRYVTLRK